MSATAAGVTATLTYDPLGRLFQVVKGGANTRFVYDGDAMVAEYDGGGLLVNRYVHGTNAAADDPLLWYRGATKRYLHADHLGSIVAATNAASTPSVNSYDEYGVPAAANVGRFQYTGQIWLSELGLYHYKARLYDPRGGRFLQTDPVGYKDQINLYVYLLDDPVNASDFLGLGQMLDDEEYKIRNRDFTGSRLGNVGAALQSERMSPEHPRATERVSGAAAKTGIAADAARAGGGKTNVGDNLKAYSSKFHGNQYVKVANVGRVAERVGQTATLVGAAADTVDLANGDMSGPKYAENRAVDAISLRGGWPGAIAAAFYHGLEQWYPGGAHGFFGDITKAEAAEIGRCNCDPDLPPWQK